MVIRTIFSFPAAKSIGSVSDLTENDVPHSPTQCIPAQSKPSIIIVSCLVKHHVLTLFPRTPDASRYCIRTVLTTNSDRQDQRTSRPLDKVIFPMRS
jgi:hypothetical protein